MGLTPTKITNVYGRISHVFIGYDEDHGIDITNGIVSFEYERIHDAIRNKPLTSATSPSIHLQQPSFFRWKLVFLGDCAIAFFETDVQEAEGEQYALVNDGFSNKIEYFRVIMPIIDAAGEERTRTYIITNGYCLRNDARIGEDQDSRYEYSGEAEYVSYTDS